MPRAASGRSSLAWGGGWVASEVATTSQGVLAAPQACSARLPKWPRARKRLRAQKPRPLRDPLPALLAILALPFQARRLPTLPQVRRRLCWTLLPYFAFFQARTSMSPTGLLLSPRRGRELVVPCPHSPARHSARRNGKTLLGSFPATRGRAHLPLRSPLLPPPWWVVRARGGVSGGPPVPWRSTPLLRLTG